MFDKYPQWKDMGLEIGEEEVNYKLNFFNGCGTIQIIYLT